MKKLLSHLGTLPFYARTLSVIYLAQRDYWRLVCKNVRLAMNPIFQ